MQLFGKVVHSTDDNIVIKIDRGLTPQQRRIINGSIGQPTALLFDDGRHITVSQRRKIYAIFREIDSWNGNYNLFLTKKQVKDEYLNYLGVKKRFSLSNCSIERASNFIEFLLGFCFSFDVPLSSKVVDSIREQYGWDMYCLKYHRCMICGAHADIAHVHAVGIGRNRKKINHEGNSVMALCREHHQMQHNVGIKTFMQRNLLKGVKVTPEIAKMLKLGNWRVERGENIISTGDEKNE